MTEPNPRDDAAELDRLREHNKQLLAELKAARTDAKALQDAAEAATSAANRWRDRYHQSAVLEPLEADLRGAAAGPWKYLRDLCIEQKLLAMAPDAEGIDQPVWRDVKGVSADLSRGLYAFLASQVEAFPDLAHALRSSGTSGSGATGSSAPVTPSEPPTPSAPVPAVSVYGLR